MALAHSPKIVSDRLLFTVDAANVKSYPGSGTTFFDVAKLKNHSGEFTNVTSDNFNGDILDLQNPSGLPDPTLIKFIEEPWIKATVITPDEYLGSIIKMFLSSAAISSKFLFKIALVYVQNNSILSVNSFSVL